MKRVQKRQWIAISKARWVHSLPGKSAISALLRVRLFFGHHKRDPMMIWVWSGLLPLFFVFEVHKIKCQSMKTKRENLILNFGHEKKELVWAAFSAAQQIWENSEKMDICSTMYTILEVLVLTEKLMGNFHAFSFLLFLVTTKIILFWNGKQHE